MEKVDTTKHSTINLTRLAPIRKGLVFAAFYELFAVLLLLGLPYLQIQVLELDILYPIFSIEKIPLFNILGYTVLTLIIIQIVYAIILPKFYTQDSNDINTAGKLLGLIIGIMMLFIIPTGTFFGALLLIQIFSKDENDLNKSVESVKSDKSAKSEEPGENNSNPSPNQQDVDNIRNKEPELIPSISKYIIITTILMLHQPIILLIMQFWIITLPIDMAYPALSVNQTTTWEIVSWVILVMFLIQIVFGIALPKMMENNRKLTELLLKIFGIFMILSFGIFLQVLILVIGIELNLDTGVLIALGLTWLFGILLNPLGVYFGKEYIKLANNL